MINKIKDAATQFTETVNTEGERTNDFTVYTGTAGIALLNLLLHQRFGDSKALSVSIFNPYISLGCIENLLICFLWLNYFSVILGQWNPMVGVKC